MLFAGLAIVPSVPVLAGGARTAHFYAADPGTYDSQNPGDDGASTALVSSLEGGDFTCTSTVVYLVLIETKDVGSTPETWNFSYDFPETGVNGNDAGHRTVTRVEMNPDDESNDQSVSNMATSSSGDLLHLSFDVDSIDSNETTYVRIEVALGCGNTTRTGNITPKQGSVTHPSGSVTVAAQTIPFKHFGPQDAAPML
jgi:hypothetical protein